MLVERNTMYLFSSIPPAKNLVSVVVHTDGDQCLGVVGENRQTRVVKLPCSKNSDQVISLNEMFLFFSIENLRLFEHISIICFVFLPG